jgi:hypothetical protein
MDQLEKYLLENRDELDRMEPVPEEAMWRNIQKSSQPKPPLEKPKGTNTWMWLAVGAFVFALLGWALLIFEKQPPVEKPETKPAVESPVAVSDSLSGDKQPGVSLEQKDEPVAVIPSPVAKRSSPKKPAIEPVRQTDEEHRLQLLVHQKKKEIGFDQLDRKAYEALFKELDELELTIEQARKDAAGFPGNERLVETMIRYYELKIRILEQLSNEINKKEYHEGLEKSI